MVPERVGRLLRPIRARGRSRLTTLTVPATITLSSPAFDDGEDIPVRHAGRGVGDDISPELRWSGVPSGTAAVILVFEDDDVPLPRPLWHTVAVLDPRADHVIEGALSSGADGITLLRTLLGRRYAGPRPLPGHGVHHYRFHLLALGQPLDPAITWARELLPGALDTVIARGVLTGTFRRPCRSTRGAEIARDACVPSKRL